MERDARSSTVSRIRLAAYAALPILLVSIPRAWIFDGHPLCLIHNLFGRACPGCGMTRALFSLLHLDFAAAWSYNPTAFLVAPLLLLVYLKEVRKTIGEL